MKLWLNPILPGWRAFQHLALLVKMGTAGIRGATIDEFAKSDSPPCTQSQQLHSLVDHPVQQEGIASLTYLYI